MRHYKVISNDNLADFNADVSQHISENWWLYEGPFVTTAPDINLNSRTMVTRWHQAVTRTGPPPVAWKHPLNMAEGEIRIAGDMSRHAKATDRENIK